MSGRGDLQQVIGARGMTVVWPRNGARSMSCSAEERAPFGTDQPSSPHWTAWLGLGKWVKGMTGQQVMDLMQGKDVRPGG